MLHRGLALALVICAARTEPGAGEAAAAPSPLAISKTCTRLGVYLLRRAPSDEARFVLQRWLFAAVIVCALTHSLLYVHRYIDYLPCHSI